MSNDKIRSAFEAWAEASGYNMSKEGQPLNSYAGTGTRMAWYGWQAASAVQAAEIVRLTSYATACKGITQDHLDGGWTASGLSKYAKGLESEIARLTAELAQARAAQVDQVKQDPFGWYVSGADIYRGQCAQMMAEREAKHCGGTCKAVPLYTHPQPSADDARRTLLAVSKVSFEFAATLTDYNLVHEFNGKEYLSRSTVMKLAQDWREQHAASMKGSK